MSRWKGMMGSVIAFAALLILMVVVLHSLQRTFYYPRHLVDPMSSLMMVDGFEAVVVQTEDGEFLHALWRAPSNGSSVILSFHGNADMPWTHAHRFSKESWHGMGVLAVAYRGYPGSTGSPSEDGLIEDAEAALAFVKRNAPGADVVLHGHSLGAAVAVALSERHASDALILEAPFLSMEAMVRNRIPIVPDFLIVDRFDSESRLPRSLACKVVVVHGTDDDVIPIEQGERLTAKIDHVLFLSVEGAGHDDVVGSVDDQVLEAVRPGCHPDRQ